MFWILVEERSKDGFVFFVAGLGTLICLAGGWLSRMVFHSLTFRKKNREAIISEMVETARQSISSDLSGKDN